MLFINKIASNKIYIFKMYDDNSHFGFHNLVDKYSVHRSAYVPLKTSDEWKDTLSLEESYF